MEIPSYLGDYREQYEKDPRRTAVRWFREAEFGLFLHYGLYSLLGRGEWVQLREKIPVAEYEKLKDRFTAEKFDAELIADLALDAGMKYVNITTRHHDSFCLFRTAQTDFNSVESPARRDLVEELAQACANKKLGLCLYYSHGRDWRHAHAANNDEWGGQARPEYDPPEPSYATGEKHDLNRYVDFLSAQLTELLTQYGPIAAIWLDGYGVPVSGPTEKFRIPETYELIWNLQQQVLISSKWGFTGTEDFLAPEINWIDRDAQNYNPVIEGNRPVEVCCSMDTWGYTEANIGKHRGPDWVMEKLEQMKQHDANLLLNTGPLPDGSIDAQDAATLREVGGRRRALKETKI